MLNRIIVQGRLTRDPERRETANGIATASFTLAVDRDFKNKETGEKQTDFIDCVAWRGTADFVSKNFTKGRMAVVEGSLHSRKWTDKNGANRVSWEITASNIYFADSRPAQTGEGSNGAEGHVKDDPLDALCDRFSAYTSDEELPF